MNGIYIHIIFLIFSMLSIKGYVSRPASYEEFDSPDAEASESSTNEESTKRKNFPARVEKLLCLLRKHQRDEEELKGQIRRLLTGFHISENRGALPPFLGTCKCKPKSVRDVLNMLDLSPHQNELLEKIVSMMQGRSCRHASGKRKSDEAPEVAINVYITATQKMTARQNHQTKLNQDQLESIAYEVVKIIKRTPYLKNQLRKFDFDKFVLPDGDTAPFEPSSTSSL